MSCCSLASVLLVLLLLAQSPLGCKSASPATCRRKLPADADDAASCLGADDGESALGLLQRRTVRADAASAKLTALHQRSSGANESEGDTCVTKEISFQALKENVTWYSGTSNRESVLGFFDDEKPVCFLPESRPVRLRHASPPDGGRDLSLAPACYQCLARAEGAWSQELEWKPAAHCGCDSSSWGSSVEELRARRNLTIMFVGDSHIRQMMLRLIAELRGESQAFDHFYEFNSTYTVSAELGRDMLKLCTMHPHFKDSAITFVNYHVNDYSWVNFDAFYRVKPSAVFFLLSWTILPPGGIATMQRSFRAFTEATGSKVYWLTVPRSTLPEVRFNQNLWKESSEGVGATVVDYAKLYMTSPYSVNAEDGLHKMCGVEPEPYYYETALPSDVHVKGWRTNLGRYDCRDPDDLVQMRTLLALYFSDVAGHAQASRPASPAQAAAPIRQQEQQQPRLKSVKRLGSPPPGSVQVVDRGGGGAGGGTCSFPAWAAGTWIVFEFLLHATVLAIIFRSARLAPEQGQGPARAAADIGLGDWRVVDGLKVVLTLAIVASHAATNAEWQAEFGLPTSGRRPPALATFWAWCGHPGMAIFFVASGALAHHSAGRDPECFASWEAIARYFRRRCLRLLPAYVVSVLFYLPAVVRAGSWPIAVAWAMQLSGDQAWFGGFQICGVDLIWNFNGPAWFVSSLLQCIYLFPWIHGRIVRGVTSAGAAAALVLACCLLRSSLGLLHAWAGFPTEHDLGWSITWGSRQAEIWYEFPLVRLLEFLSGALVAHALQLPARVGAAGAGSPPPAPAWPRALASDGCLLLFCAQFAWGSPWERVGCSDGLGLLVVSIFLYCAALPSHGEGYADGVGLGVALLRHKAWAPLAPLMYYCYIFQDCACTVVSALGYDNAKHPSIFLSSVVLLVMAAALVAQAPLERLSKS